MDDLELQTHRKQSEKMKAVEGSGSHGHAPGPVAHVPPSSHQKDEPPAAPPPAPPLGGNQNLIIAAVAVAVIGGAAFYFMSEPEAPPPAPEVSRPAEPTKREEKKKPENNAAAENERRLEQQRLQQERDKQLALQKEKERAEERERQRLQQQEEIAAANRAREAADRKRQEEMDAQRRANAGKKLLASKERLEKDIYGFQEKLVEMEEMQKNLAAVQKSIKDSTFDPEKLTRDTAIIKRQQASASAKLKEAESAAQSMATKLGNNHETTISYRNKAKNLQAEVEGYDNQLARVQEKAAADGTEYRSLQTQANAMETKIKSLSIAQGQMDTRVKDLNKIKEDPDYIELVKQGAPVDSTKLMADNFAQLRAAKNLTPAAPTTNASGGSDTTPKDAGPGVTVTNKKEKITVYTLKSGKKISSTRAVDAGDMLSVKTPDGKFESIFKEDIVKEEVQN